MKRLYFGLLCLCVLRCNDSPDSFSEKKRQSKSGDSVPAVVVEDFLVKTGQMGKAKIGMTKAEFWQAYPNAKDGVVMIEGEIPSWDVPSEEENGKPILHATYDSDTVIFLITEDTRFHTEEGIKIGDNYKKLKATYPEIKITFAEGYLANVASKRYSFFIEGEIETAQDKEGNMIPVNIGEQVQVKDISTQ